MVTISLQKNVKNTTEFVYATQKLLQAIMVHTEKSCWLLTGQQTSKSAGLFISLVEYLAPQQPWHSLAWSIPGQRPLTELGVPPV